MKLKYNDYARGEYAHSEEFQEEATAFKQSVDVARKILDVRSRDVLVDFATGPLMESMRRSLIQAFPVSESALDGFTSGVTSLLLNVRDVAEESFNDASKKALKRPSKSLIARDWDELKSDLRPRLKEVATHVVQMHGIALQNEPIQPSALRHNI